MNNTDKAWIGVDLDGTLAFYTGWKGAANIGDPIPKMLARVRKWVASGRRVKIMTARVSPNSADAMQCRSAIETWLDMLGLGDLEITHAKDQRMIELWDDRVVQVIPNTGERADRRHSICPQNPTRAVCKKSFIYTI